MNLLLVLSFLSGLTAALPSTFFPQSYQQPITTPKHDDDQCTSIPGSEPLIEAQSANPERIAIVGSGITGAVAAYTLAENARRNSRVSQPIITIFEQNPIIGGRVTTTQVFGQPELTIDTCAATINAFTDQCIITLARGTGLITSAANQVNNGTGVWNGNRFVGFVEATGFRDIALRSEYTRARLRYRYGEAAFKSTFQNLQSSYRFIGTITPFRSLLEEVKSNRLYESLIRSDCEGANGSCRNDPKDDLYLREVIEAGIRDRFFGDVDELNQLNAALGLASSTLVSIDGGNLRLIDRLIKLSGAQLLLNTKVNSLNPTKQGTGSWEVAYVSSGKSEKAIYDKVIIAAPLSLANIAILPDLGDVPLVDFADTVVTHFTSKQTINAAYFNIQGPVPQEILTSNIATNTGDKTTLPFFSFRLLDNRIRPIISNDPNQPNRPPPRNESPQYLYKIVSSRILSDAEIEALLERPGPGSQEPVLTWINRENLPKSVPRLNRALKIQDAIEIQPGLFYTGNAAQVADTIEFACKMGRNTAQLIIPSPNRGRPGNGVSEPVFVAY